MYTHTLLSFKTFTGTHPSLAQGCGEGRCSLNSCSAGGSRGGRCFQVWFVTISLSLETAWVRAFCSYSFFPLLFTKPLLGDFSDAFHGYRGLRPVPTCLLIWALIFSAVCRRMSSVTAARVFQHHALPGPWHCGSITRTLALRHLGHSAGGHRSRCLSTFALQGPAFLKQELLVGFLASSPWIERLGWYSRHGEENKNKYILRHAQTHTGTVMDW